MAAEPKIDPTAIRSDQERRRRRREGAIILAAGLAVLIFALWEVRRPGANSGATGNVFSFLLVNLNIILLLLLTFLVVRNLMKLFLERRRNVPGSQLRTRTVLSFVTIALFPAVVMLLISLEFMTNSIESWFQSDVESSLRGACRLAQTYYVKTADEALLHARALSDRLAKERFDELTNEGRMTAIVSDYQRTYKLGTVQVFDANGHELAAVFHPGAPNGRPLQSDPGLLAEALAGRPATRVESFGLSDVVRAAAPIREVEARESSQPIGVVVVDSLVEQSARAWSQEILDSFREYRRLKLNKRPFKNLYILTMALASLVVVFSATWLGLHLARGITEPIGTLSDATRRVAEGDLKVQLPEAGGDEVGTLVRAFNSMTAQLRTSHDALDERRRYIENILANVDAGVVSLDQEGVVTTVNPSAVSLLGLRDDRLVGRSAREVFASAGYPEIVGLLDELDEGLVASGTHRNVSREEEGRTVLVRATRLDLSSGVRVGAVVFVEDVSQIVQVQRMEAWKEVARRIAHEIKNPLTPIQLSAQRLHRRLRDRLEPADAELFDDCTRTIVAEVDELKKLVNEFAQFARKSTASKRPHDLNQLIEETVPLFRQSRPDIRIAFEPAADLPAVTMDRDAVKRALVNLLDNAVAAVTLAASADGARGAGGTVGGDARGADITVRTQLDRELSRVVIEVCDTGPGVPPEHRGRVFEPYFSTKPDGTGLGLAIVASVAADHHAYVRLHDNEPHGTRFVIEFPMTETAASA